MYDSVLDESDEACDCVDALLFSGLRVCHPTGCLVPEGHAAFSPENQKYWKSTIGIYKR